MQKYWQPTSLTFWTGVASFLAGLVLILAPAVPMLAPFATFAGGFFPGQDGGALMIAGLGLIGIKAAIASNGVKAVEAAVNLAAAVAETSKAAPVTVAAPPAA